MFDEEYLEDDPVDQLTNMGFSLTAASDALLQSNGSLPRAIQLLTQEETTTATKKEKRKKKKGKQSQNNDNNKSFKEQRKEELRIRKEQRDKKKTCRVCGGPHSRNECPGIADDGRGHSRHHAPATKSRRQRKQWQEATEQDQAFLQQGVWTESTPYLDGFANLVELFQQSESDKGIIEWLGGWSNRSVSLGDESMGVVSMEQRKAELKRWAGSKLRQRVESLQGQQKVEEALQDADPRSAMVRLILECEYNDEEQAHQHRILEEEWPGYRGCITPISVLEHSDLFEEFNRIDGTGLKFLLSVSPKDISKWMQVQSDSGTRQMDLASFAKIETDLASLQSEMKKAADILLISKQAKRTSAEAEVARIRKLIAKQHALQLDAEDVFEEATDISVSSRVEVLLGENLDSSHRHVVGVSCGLDYELAEANHPRFGEAICKAQREVCTMVMKAAVKAGLPIVLECNDADKQSKAASDLVRILVKNVPSDAKILLRSGSLTAAEKPGVAVLLQTFPRLFIGLSAQLSFTKCPKALLDAAFDLPLERLILTSEAPSCLPPTLGSFVDACLPPFAACVATAVAEIKGNITQNEVLQASTENVITCFGTELP